jgi:hypothetical protein
MSDLADEKQRTIGETMNMKDAGMCVWHPQREIEDPKST